MNQKNLLFALTMLFVFSSSGQITLGPGDFIVAGKTITMMESYSDTLGTQMTAAVNLGNPGAAGTYNITGITPYLEGPSTYHYVDPLTLPFTAAHPTANVAFYSHFSLFDITGDTLAFFYSYIKSDNSGQSLVGISALWDTLLFGTTTPSPVAIWGKINAPLSSPIELMSSNYTLGYQHYDSSHSILDMGGFYRCDYAAKELEIDGWGILTTPIGSYGVLRGKIEARRGQGWTGDTNNISWEKQPKEYYYEFYTKQVGMPIAVIGMDSSWTTVRYVNYALTPPAVISENNGKQKMDLYPNPAGDVITLTWPENNADKLRIFSPDGRLVSEVVVVSAQQDIPLHDLAPGLYHVILETGEGESVYGRFLKK